jgi:hypothetical protein
MAGGHRFDQALIKLLANQTGTDDPNREIEIEELLTDGYARVLELEVERRRVMGQGDRADAVDEITRQLVSLRDRLGEVNRRFGSSRQRDLDRRPVSGDGLDEERPS